ncbi:MAG TPA: hypothetical protein VK655_08165 [Solirubrobacteraceae bacterium]|nr:hypothetical protein [Solirubrobacteraceae bacterium]
MEVRSDGAKASGYGGQFGGDGVLLALEQIQRHRFGQVGIEKRFALGFEFALPALLRRAFVLSIESQLRQLFFQKGAHCH